MLKCTIEYYQLMGLTRPKKRERRVEMMRFKKYFGIAVALLAMTFALSGCDLGGDEHEHSFGRWSVTKQSGCVDAGVQSRECEECGYVETAEIAAVGHTTVRDPFVKATCTTDGLSEGSHCGTCGEILQAQEPIAAFGHAPLKDYPVEPTCTAEGLTEGSHCGLCGVVIEEQKPVAPTGHKYDKVTILVEANCQKPGSKNVACIWCNVSYTEVYTTTEHTVVPDLAVAATCTQTGLTEGSHCSVCKLVITAQKEVPALGHNPIHEAYVAPTCTEDGQENGIHCAICLEQLQTPTVLPALGHQMDEEILQQATCMANGLKQLTCTVCAHTEQAEYQMPQVSDVEIYSAAAEFVCQIYTYDKSNRVINEGVGFVYSSDGKIITNFSLIMGAYSATVTINQMTYPVELVLAYDQTMDLAVLQVDVEGLVPAQICTMPLTDGQTVYALGPAKGLNNTYTQGVILSAARVMNGVVYVQHNAAVTLENSGGPLMNAFGEVVGISCYNISAAQGVGMAVFASEWSRLNYGQPISMAELYEQTISVHQQIVDMILANGTTDGLGNVVLYSHQITSGGVAIFELAYEPTTGRVFVEMSDTANGNKTLARIYLSDDPARMQYTCQFSSASKVLNTMYGMINAGAYTTGSDLTYASSEGMIGHEDVMLMMYKRHINDTLQWLNSYLSDNLQITIAELGFVEFQA